MKRIMICLLVCVLALIGGTAMAERYLFAIEDPANQDGPAYAVMPGKIILTERVDGKIHAEGRVVVRNKLPRPVYYDASGFLVGYSPSTGESVVIEGLTARPATVAQSGYSLLTYSADVEMNIYDDWTFKPFFNLGDASSTPVWIGVGDAALEPYEGSAALKGWRYLDDLPQGIYQCVMLFADAEHRFLWAEDVTINTELNQKISVSLEDYEVELFRKYGKEPTFVELILQQK